ncbi:hypothetical protein ACFY0A_36955 [Streptomyces sp. NPDC001698]|uniref:hypothetical protein n=1 Tax=unclassified Streptomyces TaxID=2593676 RepID=UPI0036B045A2
MKFAPLLEDVGARSYGERMIPGFHRAKGGGPMVGIRPGDDVAGPFGPYGVNEGDESESIEDEDASTETAGGRPVRVAPGGNGPGLSVVRGRVAV